MRRMVIRSLVVLICIAGLVVLLLWMQGTIGPRRVAPGGVTLERVGHVLPGAKTVSVHTEPMEQWEEAIGTVKSKTTIAVSAKVMAHILEIKANPGDSVRAGDVLVVLDSREIRSQLERARSALLGAQANLVQAQSNYNRVKAQLKDETATPAEMEVAEASYKMAQAQLKQAEEAVKEAEITLGYTTIASPITGIVVEKHAEAGDLAIPGQTLLALEDPLRLRLEASVPERLGGLVKVGDRVKVVVGALHLQLDATVDEVVPSADPLSRSFLVKAALPKHEGLRAGMYGRLLFAPKKVPALCIPAQAVRTVGQLSMVTVVEDGRPRVRLVQTGKAFGDLIEVLSGLRPGENVLIGEAVW